MQTIFVVLGILSFLFGGVSGFTVEGFHLGGAGFMACGVVLAGVSAHGRYFRPPNQAVKVGKCGFTRSFVPRPGEKGLVRSGRFLILRHGILVGTIERLYEFRVEDSVEFWRRNISVVGEIDKIEIPGPHDPDAIYRVSYSGGTRWFSPDLLTLIQSKTN